MGQEFPIPIRDQRFQLPPGDGKVLIAMTSSINPDIKPDGGGHDASADPHAKPQASDWLWRPLGAKLWWTGIAIYWTGRLISSAIPALDEFYASALAGFLNVFFFPPFALMVLGLGYARAWFDRSDWEFVEPTQEQMFPKRSIGGMRDPASDPLDPRSGLHWQHFHRHR